MSNYESYMKNLPVIPEVAVKILSLAEDNVDISFHDLEEVIKIDPALTAKVLKVANSALYARQAQISSLSRAISLLGFKTIKSLVLILSAASAFKVEGTLPFYREFWQTSVLTAFYSKELAIDFFDKSMAEDVFLAGLIHSIGQIALYRHSPETYHEILSHHKSNLDISDIERNFFEIDHRTLGADILRDWTFPDIFIDCAKEYGFFNIVSKFKKEIILVSLGNLIAQESLKQIKIEEDFLQESRWLDYFGISYTLFLDIKESIVKRVEEDNEYKECAILFAEL